MKLWKATLFGPNNPYSIYILAASAARAAAIAEQKEIGATLYKVELESGQGVIFDETCVEVRYREIGQASEQFSQRGS